MQELPLREGMGSAQECQDLVYSGKMLKEGRQAYHAEPVWQTEDGSGDNSLWGGTGPQGTWCQKRLRFWPMKMRAGGPLQ